MELTHHTQTAQVQEGGCVLVELENHIAEWKCENDKAMRVHDMRSLQGISNYQRMLKGEITDFINIWFIKGVRCPMHG